MNIAAGGAAAELLHDLRRHQLGLAGRAQRVYTSYDYGAADHRVPPAHGQVRRVQADRATSPQAVAAAHQDRRRRAAPRPTPTPCASTGRVNPDDGTQFLFLRHADTRVTATHETGCRWPARTATTRASRSRAPSAWPGGTPSSSLAGYDLGGQRLVYSTSEIMTHAKVDERDVALLYGRDGEDGETVLRYASEPTVKVRDGGTAQSTWDAARGDLRLNYTHATGPRADHRRRPPAAGAAARHRRGRGRLVAAGHRSRAGPGHAARSCCARRPRTAPPSR